tara:strand:- start:1016 stop:1480 length:465 start_codon:yes stop_codon:yes gene_type:complete
MDSSKMLLRSIYDYEGDQAAEIAAAAAATGGRSTHATDLMSAVLSDEETGKYDERAAKAALRRAGVRDVGGALAKIKTAKEQGGRGKEVEKAMELLGSHVDQTLATPIEAMGTAADQMATAGTTLEKAGRMLQAAAIGLHPDAETRMSGDSDGE